MNNLQIADLLLALYGGATGSFDFVEYGTADDQVCWALKRVDGVDVVLLRGSYNAGDWLRDFTAITWPMVMMGGLGPVHPGFAQGMAKMWSELQTRSSGPWIVAGHSLGAGRAAILSGMMVLTGKPPVRRVGLGEPKPGFRRLAEVLANVPCDNYRNGDSYHHDLVTDVPLSFPPEDYVHSSALTFITAKPPEDDQWGVFAWHHMELYRAALEAAGAGK